MKLYDYTMAPNPRRVRIFIAEKGLDIENVTVDLGAKEQLQDAYRAKNPELLVPALELDDGTIIGETMAICRYLEEIHPQPALLGQTALEKAQVEMWQRRMEMNGLAAVAEAFRNTVPGFAGRAVAGPHDYEQIPDLAARGLQRIEHFFTDLNNHLASSPYVAGDAYSVADITALVAIDFAKVTKKRPDESLTALAAWHEKVSARPSAKA